MARLPDKSIDMALLDLPYGVTACKWDTPLPLEPLWVELKRVCKPRAAMVFTAIQPFTSRLVSSNYEMFRYEWMWDKNIANNPLNVRYSPLRRHENILVFSKQAHNYYPQLRQKPHSWIRKSGRTFRLTTSPVYNHIMVSTGEARARDWMYPHSIIKINAIHPSKERHHPTQKPVALFEYLIKTYTQEHEIVLDFVCGSGTTAIAARKCGRQFICGDITLEYVELARKRLQDTDPYQATELSNGMKQLSLFEQGA